MWNTISDPAESNAHSNWSKDFLVMQRSVKGRKSKQNQTWKWVRDKTYTCNWAEVAGSLSWKWEVMMSPLTSSVPDSRQYGNRRTYRNSENISNKINFLRKMIMPKGKTFELYNHQEWMLDVEWINVAFLQLKSSIFFKQQTAKSTKPRTKSTYLIQ